MLKQLNFFLVSTLLLSLTACSTFPNKIWYKNVDQLILENNYKKALEQISKNNTDNPQRYLNIQKQANKHADVTLARINQLITNKEWGQAKHHLQKLEDNSPWQPRFNQLKNKIMLSQRNELRLIETKQALAEAELLQAKQLKFNHQARSTASGSKWFLPIASFDSEKDKLAESLYRLSLLALSKQDYENAHKTYSAALKLNGHLEKYTLTKTITQGLNKDKEHTILSQQNELLNKMDRAIKNQNFTEIIRLQNILSTAPFKGEDVKQAIKKANIQRLSRAKILAKEADTIYRQGNINVAITMWKEAKMLAPSLTQLSSKIARANKVQSKLDHLRNLN